MSAFEQAIKATPGIEGFVIRFHDGRMYKIKTEWYFERTKKEKQQFSLNSERSVWQIILDQQIDDALAFFKVGSVVCLLAVVVCFVVDCV